MAKKKSAVKKQDETTASQTKAASPKGRRKKAEAQGRAPAAAPTARSASAGAAKGGAKKAAAGVKLNDKQRDLLGKIKGAGEPGYTIGQKIEQRTINALQERKLIKRGAKNKETGTVPYVLTKAGEKNLGSGASESTS